MTVEAGTRFYIRNDGRVTWRQPSEATHGEPRREYRPLILLDLSPHEVTRALQTLRESRGMIAVQVADKLEEAAKVLGPPEPTGLGAIVVDTNGVRWVRVRSGSPGCDSWISSQAVAWTHYCEIAAVRVIREGDPPPP